MFKIVFVTLLAFCIMHPQSIVQKSECSSMQKGGIWNFAVLKNPADNKMYCVTVEVINAKDHLLLYDASFKRLSTYQLTEYGVVSGIFIRNGKLYFADDNIKYISLDDFSVAVVNKDRKGIRKISLSLLNNKEVILAQNSTSLFLFELPSHKELLNIRINDDKDNFRVSLIYKGNIYYSSRSDELTKYDVSANKISWQIRFPEKPIKLLGIRVTSMPNWLLSIIPFEEKGVDYISAFLGAGDNFRINAGNGKIVLANKEYDTFTDVKQSNVKLFSSTHLFQVKSGNEMLYYAGAIDKNVYCLSGNNLDERWVTPVGNEISGQLSFYDINNDSFPEVFGVTDYDDNLFVLDGKTGGKIIMQSMKTGKIFNQTRAYLADFFGTGSLNIIVLSNRSTIKVLELNPAVKVPLHYIHTFEN